MNTEKTKIDCIFKADHSRREIDFLLSAIQKAELLSGDSSFIKQYENSLKSFFKCKHAIAVSSGTAALHASLIQTINPNDEVLVPVISVPMTINAVIEAGGIPIFYDCQPDSFMPCLESLNANMSDKSKVLITVSMWGYPAINNMILNYARSNNLVVIEDAAQSAGTVNHDKFEGTIGNIGCFSTHEFKMISTGEGGFILTDEDIYAEKIRSFTHNGFDYSSKSFGHVSGLNYKLSTLQAALGIAQLNRLEEKINTRNKKMQYWKESLSACNDIAPFFSYKNLQHNGYSLCFTIRDISKFNAKQLSEELSLKDINTDIFRYRKSLMVEYPKYYKFYKEKSPSGNIVRDFPNAYNLMERMLVVPCHDEVCVNQISKAATIIKKIFKGYH